MSGHTRVEKSDKGLLNLDKSFLNSFIEMISYINSVEQRKLFHARPEKEQIAQSHCSRVCSLLKLCLWWLKWSRDFQEYSSRTGKKILELYIYLCDFVTPHNSMNFHDFMTLNHLPVTCFLTHSFGWPLKGQVN